MAENDGKIKDGGPAFPGKAVVAVKISYDEYGNNLSEPVYEEHEGMTLRDYFAAAALTGLMARGGDISVNNVVMGIDRVAYIAADAMLKERQK